MNEQDWRSLEQEGPPGDVLIAGVRVKPGDRVRVRAKGRSDVWNLILDGKTASVASIEQDYEGQIHVAVVIDDDPGRDVGFAKLPGHRFFFDPDDLEPLATDEAFTQAISKDILVAGIGNIFLGDDAFGVEVVKHLSEHTFPVGVRVVDFGIRGYDLAYTLLDGPELTILVDACPRGAAPGTVYVMDLEGTGDDERSDMQAADAHSMDPVNVLRLAKTLGGTLKRILLVGCEPATFGPEGGQMGLSDPVSRAVEVAAEHVKSLVMEFLETD